MILQSLHGLLGDWPMTFLPLHNPCCSFTSKSFSIWVYKSPQVINKSLLNNLLLKGIQYLMGMCFSLSEVVFGMFTIAVFALTPADFQYCHHLQICPPSHQSDHPLQNPPIHATPLPSHHLQPFQLLQYSHIVFSMDQNGSGAQDLLHHPQDQICHHHQPQGSGLEIRVELGG